MTDIQAWVQPALPRVTDGVSGNTSSPAGSTSTSGMGSTALSGMAAVTRQLHQSMQSIMDKLMQMEITGDADHDYARMIMQHYKDTMAKVETQYGKTRSSYLWPRRL